MVVTINQIKYTPKIKNSVILLFCSNEGYDIAQLSKFLENINYDTASKLFVFAVQKEGGNLTLDEVHAELDERMDFFVELMTYIAEQLNPGSLGEQMPVKSGSKRKK